MGEKSSGRSAHYKLTSTSMLWLQTNKARSGTMNLGGSLTRQVEQDASVSESSPHIANIGRLVEDMENKIRNTLNEIYFGKTKDIVNGLRSVQPLAEANKMKDLRTSCSTSYNKRMLARLTKDFLPTHLYPLVPCLFISGQVINSTTVI